MSAGDAVLIVEPEPATRATLQVLLERNGYLVRIADAFASALASFTSAPCSLLISAFELGDHTGIELLEALRTRLPALAVIIVGPRAPRAVQAALRSKADDYLFTPIREGELATALSRASQAYAARVQHEALERRLLSVQADQAGVVQAASLAAMGRLAASLAHEINNPLTPIIGMAELLTDELPEGHVGREYAETIIGSGRRIQRVVRSLLDFARPAVQQRVPVELANLVQSTLLLVEQQLADGNISTIVSLPEESFIVLANPAQLRQALLALIENAREAMPQGGTLQLLLTSEPAFQAGREEPMRQAVIAISDTGFGIPEQHLPYIFEPFYSTKHQVAGVGLGLAIANTIVGAHGGRIEFTTSEGRGSTFRIILPIHPG